MEMQEAPAIINAVPTLIIPKNFLLENGFVISVLEVLTDCLLNLNCDLKEIKVDKN